jgi:hypothetical protein
MPSSFCQCEIPREKGFYSVKVYTWMKGPEPYDENAPPSIKDLTVSATSVHVVDPYGREYEVNLLDIDGPITSIHWNAAGYMTSISHHRYMRTSNGMSAEATLHNIKSIVQDGILYIYKIGDDFVVALLRRFESIVGTNQVEWIGNDFENIHDAVAHRHPELKEYLLKSRAKEKLFHKISVEESCQALEAQVDYLTRLLHKIMPSDKVLQSFIELSAHPSDVSEALDFKASLRSNIDEYRATRLGPYDTTDALKGGSSYKATGSKRS